MAAAVAIGIAIELMMMFGAAHMHTSDEPPAPAAPPVMHAVLEKIDTPPPPPPPPPPKPEIKKIVKHQSIAPRPTPQPQPAPPAPAVIPAAETPAPSAPAVATASNSPPPQAARPAAASSTPVAIGLVCPQQAAPEMPKRAIAEGIVGSVLARARISAGKVVQVDILKSKPAGVFDEAVRRAMMSYRCDSNSTDTVVAEQSFNFTLAD